jgi:hypothetical protein
MAKQRSNPAIRVNPSGPVPAYPPPPPTKSIGDMASGFVPPAPSSAPPTDAAAEGGRRAPKEA